MNQQNNERSVMSKIEKDQLKPGACCSLRSNGDCMGPAVVLVKSCGNQEWQAAPLFSEGEEAGEHDVLLEPDTDWLYGENWCATGNTVIVHERRLYGCLGHLSPMVLEKLNMEIDGDRSDLARGPAILEALGDPRKAFHRNLEDNAKHCGKLSGVALAAVALRLVKEKAAREWTVFREGVANAIDVVLTPVDVLPLPVTRGHGDDLPAKAWNMNLPPIGDIKLEICGDADSVRLELTGDGIKDASIRPPYSETYESCECIGNVWIAGDLDPIPAGKCQFRLTSESGDPVELDIDILSE